MTCTPEEDQRLLAMKASGASVALIAKAFHKTEVAMTSLVMTFKRRPAKSLVPSDD
jgi:hypothetical protein